MASYKVQIRASAAKELNTVPKKDRKRIVAKLEGLIASPRPHGAEQLSGDDKYRLRQGNYRVLYSIDDSSETITIVKIGHRREVYRK